ncbi:MAG: hypothetical protein FJ404_17520 [Verrucomicrobia bacterium]|nr:hypothetical protein [Verrucomicrobiota bacterium]
MDEFLPQEDGPPTPFANLREKDGKCSEALGLENVPTSLLIDGQSKVLSVHVGFEGESTGQALRKEIEGVLAAARK